VFSSTPDCTEGSIIISGAGLGSVVGTGLGSVVGFGLGSIVGPGVGSGLLVQSLSACSPTVPQSEHL